MTLIAMTTPTASRLTLVAPELPPPRVVPLALLLEPEVAPVGIPAGMTKVDVVPALPLSAPPWAPEAGAGGEVALVPLLLGSSLMVGIFQIAWRLIARDLDSRLSSNTTDACDDTSSSVELLWASGVDAGESLVDEAFALAEARGLAEVIAASYACGRLGSTTGNALTMVSATGLIVAFATRFGFVVFLGRIVRTPHCVSGAGNDSLRIRAACRSRD